MNHASKQLIVKHADEVPGHSMYGEWALPGRQYSYLLLRDLALDLGRGRKARRISHQEIFAKPGDWFGRDDFSGPRFEAADPRFPGMVVAGMPNPCELPFRLVDGRRRLEKLRRAGVLESNFFVFDYAEILPYIFDFEIAS